MPDHRQPHSKAQGSVLGRAAVGLLILLLGLALQQTAIRVDFAGNGWLGFAGLFFMLGGALNVLLCYWDSLWVPWGLALLLYLGIWAVAFYTSFSFVGTSRGQRLAGRLAHVSIQVCPRTGDTRECLAIGYIDLPYNLDRLPRQRRRVIEELVGPLRLADEWRVCFRRHNRGSNNVDWMLRGFYIGAAKWGERYPAIGRAMLEDLRRYDPMRGGLPACGELNRVATHGTQDGQSWLDDPGVQMYLEYKGISVDPSENSHPTR